VAIITAVSYPKVCTVNVVVDGLRHTDAGHPVLTQIERHRLCIVATQGDEGIDFVGFQNFLDLLNAAGNFLHIGSRRVKNGAALQLDAVGVFQGERDKVVVQHAAPAVQEADEFIAIVVDSLLHGGVDHRIQSGAVTATGQ
jgi:hypothetical protein